MEIQEIIVVVLFLLCLFFIGKTVYKNFRSKDNCGGGCSKCAMDPKNFPKDLKS